MQDALKRQLALVEDVKTQANELFKDEYCRGQIVYARISRAKLEDYEDSDIPSDILELKNFTDNAGNINKDKLDSLKKSCVVGFDIDRDDYSELLDVNKFSIGLASSFYLTNAHFDSEENIPTISCEAVFFMPIAEGIDKINFDMSDNPIEYFEEGFELFIPIDGEYGVPPAERCSYAFGEVLEFNRKENTISINKGLRVNWDDIEDIGIISHYKGKPITGICYGLYDNGNLQEEVELENGLKHGFYKNYHKNGNLSEEGSYKDDKFEDGVVKFYYESGELSKEVGFKNLHCEYHGVVNFYYKNGQLKSEGTAKDHKLCGTMKLYYENGQLEQEYIYGEEGLESKKCWDENGNKKDCQ